MVMSLLSCGMKSNLVPVETNGNAGISYRRIQLKIGEVESDSPKVTTSIGEGLESFQRGPENAADTHSIDSGSEAASSSPDLADNESTTCVKTSIGGESGGNPPSTLMDMIVIPTGKPGAVSVNMNNTQEGKTGSEVKVQTQGSSYFSVPVVSAVARSLQQKRFDQYLQALDKQFYVRPEYTVNHIPHRASGLGNVIFGTVTTAFIAAVTGRTFHSTFCSHIL